MSVSPTSVWMFTKKRLLSLSLSGASAALFASTDRFPTRLATKLSQTGSVLRFCYEAGPCGYAIQRQLAAAGHDCVVVAASLISRKPGDRIKTGRRDAINLAKLHRAGGINRNS